MDSTGNNGSFDIYDFPDADNVFTSSPRQNTRVLTPLQPLSLSRVSQQASESPQVSYNYHKMSFQSFKNYFISSLRYLYRLTLMFVYKLLS